MPGLSEAFEDTILKGLQAYFFGKSGGCFALLALSGGADSTAMTAAMAALRDRGVQLELHALHVNHGIRPPDACAVDEKTAAELCDQLKITFTVKRIPPGKIKAYARQYGTGVEGAARYFRYQALREEAERLSANAIVTAHTADDRLETILMAFLRGAGPAGLGALSDLTVDSNVISGSGMVAPILRPLLSLSRMDVLAYVKERDLGYCSDETNEDQRFFRNKLRRGLIPFLDDQFPYWRETALRLGDTQAMTSAFLKEATIKKLQWENESPKMENESNQKSAGLIIAAEQFFSQPVILREEALFLAIDRIMENEGSGKRPRRDALRSFAQGKETAVDMGQSRLINKNGLITVKKAVKQQCKYGFSVLIKRAGVYKLNDVTIIAGDQPDAVMAIFYAACPLTVYSEGDGKIFAEDRFGRAAVIQKGALVWKRENPAGCDTNCFSIEAFS